MLNRYFRYFDWISLILITMISSIGILLVFSASYSVENPYSIFFKKQTFGIVTGLLIYLIISFVDYKNYIALDI